MIETTQQLIDFIKTPAPKGSFEEILRKLSAEDENVNVAIMDLLGSLPLEEVIKTIKKWREI